MTIETWQERVIPELHSDNISRDYMQNEIYDLRAALKERDEDIARVKDINRSLVDKANRQNIHDARQSEVLTAQRKVLEQALEALKYVGAGSYQQHAAAFTAIQEVLK
jgi:hypothetical protein